MLEALQNELKAIIKANNDLLAKGKDNDLTDEEWSTIDANQVKITQLQGRIETVRKAQAAAKAASTKPIQQPIDTGTNVDGEDLLPDLDAEGKPKVKATDVAPDPKRGWSDLGEFAVACHNAGMVNRGGGFVDPRLVAATGDNFHAVASDDGFEVPPHFVEQVWEIVLDDAELLAMTEPEPTNSNSVEFNVDPSTPWDSNGIQTQWLDEGGQLTESRLYREPRDVKLHKLGALVSASSEIRQDAPRLENRLMRKAPEAIRFTINDAIINGDGVGKPLGIANSSGIVTVAKESGQTADTVVTSNVTKMWARMLPSSKRRAIWLINDDVWPELLELTLGNQPIFLAPSNDIKQAPGGRLLGRPIFPSEYAQTLGDQGDIYLFDPMGYYSTIKRGGLQFADSMHLLFDFDKHVFRWIFRVGGQPYLDAPIDPQFGTNTKSHFIRLAARA